MHSSSQYRFKRFSCIQENNMHRMNGGPKVWPFIEENKLSKEIGTYRFAFWIQNPNSKVLEIVGQIQKTLHFSSCLFFSLLTEGGKVFSKVFFIQYRPSPSAGWLEVTVLLKSSCVSILPMSKIKKFKTEPHNRKRAYLEHYS